MVFGYIRVSSDKQTTENQKFEISRYCEKNGVKIDKWVEEKNSGALNYSKRKLGKILKTKAC